MVKDHRYDYMETGSLISIMRYFRLYMLVGGMPQAVETYIETNNFRKVDEIERDILKLYEDDFRKIDASGRISMLYVYA